MSTAEDQTSDASGMAEQQGQARWLSGVREGYADIGDVRLHYVEAGDGARDPAARHRLRLGLHCQLPQANSGAGACGRTLVRRCGDLERHG